MEKNLLAVKSFLVLFVILVSPQFVLAQSEIATSATTSERSYYSSKKSNTDLEFVFLSEQMKDRRTYSANGIYNNLGVSVLHSPTKNEDFRLYLASVYESNDERDNQQYFELTEFMYRMKHLLTQKKNGVRMDLELKSYYVLENDLRDRWGFGGAFIPQLVFKKKLASWLSLTAKIRQHINMRKNSRSYTVKDQTRIYLSPTIIFNRHFMFNTDFTWKHKNRVAKSKYAPKETDVIELRPSLMYLVNHSFLTEIYTDTKLAKSHDGRTFNENLTDQMVYGVGMYWTAF